MARALHHRGPDHESVHLDGPLGLGHARLSIIDLATGDQPVSNEDGSIQVVFNGEIFNYVELRAELQAAGHAFRTTSDTETLVHAYEEWGDAFVQRLNGQFAIALWDGRRRRLLLVRDRLGIRPLYWRREADGVRFASEVKALLAGARERGRMDFRGLAQCFTFWTPLGERTVFDGVRSLRPGHLLAIDAAGEAMTCWWRWRPGPRVRPDVSMHEAAEELRALLADAVRLQLRADVPVGAYLSGGLDSSAIVALVRRHANMRLRTFSVAFEDAEYDETAFQRQVAEQFGTEHTAIRCSAQDVGEVFPRVVEHAETPVLRTGPAPLLLLSGLVRRSGYKVVLTGEGADEVFAGYDLFKEARIRRFWARQPASRWRPSLLSRLYPYLRRSPVGNRAFAESFFRPGATDPSAAFYAHAPRWAATRRIWNFLAPALKAELAGWEPEHELAPLVPPDFREWDALSRDQFVEVETLLYGYLLSSQGERMAMANSVEGRVPFLDHRVVEFANALPARLKLAGLREKAVLREAMRPLLPAAITDRVKQPYRAPDVASFFAGGQPLDYVAAVLGRANVQRAGYFDAAAVEQLVGKCRAGRALGAADNMAFVGILSTMLLHERYMSADAVRVAYG
jgi:asparagine synthase (glutamine-hydrolysing)